MDDFDLDKNIEDAHGIQASVNDKVLDVNYQEEPISGIGSSSQLSLVIENSSPSNQQPRSNNPSHLRSNQSTLNHRQVFPIRPIIIGHPALNDVVRRIADFMYRYCEVPDVEIEAKIGILVSRQQRVQFGIETAAVIRRIPEISFESSLGEPVFITLNNFLNRNIENGTLKAYCRTKEKDYFGFYGMDSHRRIRLSVDPVTGAHKRCIEKKSIEDLDIHCPELQYDLRLSAKQEIHVPLVPSSEFRSQFARKKDRISYVSENFWTVDITTVRDMPGGLLRESELEIDESLWGLPTYEAELEICNMPALIAEKKAMERKEPSSFENICRALYNNMKLMASIVPPPAAGSLPLHRENKRQRNE